MYDAIVIGAGLAGIATALRLRRRGAKVLILEKNDYVGGKMNQFESQGYRFDTGPSLFTMPEYVNDLYDLFGENPQKYYRYKKHSESCRYFFEDGDQLTFYTDRDALLKELSTKLGINPDPVGQYLDDAALKYTNLEEIFLDTAIHKATQIPWKKVAENIPLFMKSGLLKSLNTLNQKQLNHDK